MLEARSLTKYYNHTPAVRGVSFTIRPGEILGCLGPNGAGKSTTVKMLTGLIEPSQGQIFYRGRSVHDDFTAFQRRIGYVPEEPHLYPHLTGREYLQLTGRLRGMPREELEPKLDEFLGLLALWSDRHTPLASYSKGMRQKILLASALLHDPDLLILDEPFSGLDVTSAMMLRSLLRGLAERGKMILYSSHVLEVVEKVCSNVLILRKGEVVAYDSIHRLRELMSQPSLEGVFAQLAEVENTEEVAGRILDAMSPSHPGSPPLAQADGPPLPDRPVQIGLRIYRGMARAFPEEFTSVCGGELLQVTEEAIEPVWRRHGWFGLIRLLADLAIRVPIEHAAELGKDVRYALRTLAASPGFTAVALLSLSLGICIATCAFSELNGMAFRNIQRVAHPEQLAALQLPASYPAYRRYQAQRELFSSTLAYVAPVPFMVSAGERTERIWGHLVTPSYFATLGVSPALGRLFAEDGGEARQMPEIVLSDRYWRDHLGSDPSVTGRSLRINGHACTVVGVAPRDFQGASPLLFPADLWMPLSAGRQVAPELAGDALERNDRAMFRVVGRLRPGVTSTRSEAQLDAVARQFERDTGDSHRDQAGRRVLLVEGGKALPLRRQDVPFFTSFLMLMIGLVMLIASSNVANMMLARAAGRRREIAVRIALGARPSRIVRQLLTESMIVALGAGAAGFCASTWLMGLGSQIRMPLPIPVRFDFRPDGRVLLVTTLLTVAAGLAFGLVPALESTRADLASALKGGGNAGLGRRRYLSPRNLLMVSQVAGSLTLLVVLGMLSLGIQTTMGVQSGFDPRNLYLLSLDPIRDGYQPEQAKVFFEKLLDRVHGLRSVTAASLTESLPVSMAGASVIAAADAGGARTVLTASRHVVGRDYFATTGIPILLGRAFRKDDEVNATPTVIVSQELVRRLWKSDDPLGRTIEIGNGEPAAAKILPGSYDYRPAIAGTGRQTFEVVGMARDTAEGLVVQKPRPAIYFPLRAAQFAQPPAEGVTLMVRAAPGVDAVAAVRREIASMDANITVFDVRSMTDHIDRFMSPLRIAASTYGVVGIFGLLLAAVGLAGVTAYSVAQRAREIGIRMALGARKADVLGLVMKQGASLVAVGTLLGMAGSWAGARLLAAMNSSVGRVTSTGTSDPLVIFGAPALLAALALLACYLPARHSTRVDPVVVLRQE